MTKKLYAQRKIYLEEKRYYFKLIIIWFSYNDVRRVTKTAVILVKISNLYFIFVTVLLLHKNKAYLIYNWLRFLKDIQKVLL